MKSLVFIVFLFSVIITGLTTGKAWEHLGSIGISKMLKAKANPIGQLLTFRFIL